MIVVKRADVIKVVHPSSLGRQGRCRLIYKMVVLKITNCFTYHED